MSASPGPGYPIILIDEYQDSFKQIIDKFIEYFVSKKIAPQFGFFGDAWQTIYQSNNVCGLITHDNIIEIKKNANFRCAPRIVDVLNYLRPSLPQVSAINNCDGEAIVITCNDYTGPRRKERIFENDLPVDVLENRLTTLINSYKKHVIPNEESIKVLMITHKVLASQQGYDKLLDILGDGFRNADDPLLLFFMNTVEPIYKAIKTNNMLLLFSTLGINQYPVNKKSEKTQWHNLGKSLELARTQSAIQVMTALINSGLVPIPPQIITLHDMFFQNPNIKYQNSTLGNALNLNYSEYINAIAFLMPTSSFSTEHGVKGEEYDNVIFVISRGWNNYQFDRYIPMLKHNTVPDISIDAFERNRNLFYVCCSRSKKRLVLFVTIPVEGEFKEFLENMVGVDNVYTYADYLRRIERQGK